MMIGLHATRSCSHETHDAARIRRFRNHLMFESNFDIHVDVYVMFKLCIYVTSPPGTGARVPQMPKKELARQK